MNPNELRFRLAAFPGWDYRFNFDGITTPIWNEAAITWREKRGRYFFDTLVRLCGRSPKGWRALDLGCNVCLRSRKAIEAGCDFVPGINGRQRSPRNSKTAVSPGRGTCGSAVKECKTAGPAARRTRLLWLAIGMSALAVCVLGVGFADRELLAATLNTVHRKELLNG